jgi:hypothetical protein
MSKQDKESKPAEQPTTIRCRLRQDPMASYGQSVRTVGKQSYELAQTAWTVVRADDVPVLQKIEPLLQVEA